MPYRDITVSPKLPSPYAPSWQQISSGAWVGYSSPSSGKPIVGLRIDVADKPYILWLTTSQLQQPISNDHVPGLKVLPEGTQVSFKV